MTGARSSRPIGSPARSRARAGCSRRPRRDRQRYLGGSWLPAGADGPGGGPAPNLRTSLYLGPISVDRKDRSSRRPPITKAGSGRVGPGRDGCLWHRWPVDASYLSATIVSCVGRRSAAAELPEFTMTLALRAASYSALGRPEAVKAQIEKIGQIAPALTFALVPAHIDSSGSLCRRGTGGGGSGWRRKASHSRWTASSRGTSAPRVSASTMSLAGSGMIAQGLTPPRVSRGSVPRKKPKRRDGDRRDGRRVRQWP